MALDEGMDADFGALVKQWVIGDTPPSEVKRRVNPLMYQHDRHCAIPGVSHERLGYVEGTNAGSSTMLNVEYLDWIAKSYPWGNGLTLHLPVEGGGDMANYPGSVVVHEDSLIAGFRIPLALFMGRLLSTMELSPARVTPTSWKYFNAFAHHCVDKGFYPEYDQVCMLFERRGPDNGVFNFCTANTNLVQPNYVYRWRERWFLVRQRGEYTFGFPLYSKEPKDFPKYKLGSSHRKLLKTVLELPIPKKQAKVLTDDLLESAGISYPFKRTNQYVVENVDATAEEAKKKKKKKAAKKEGCELEGSLMELLPQQRKEKRPNKGKRIAAEVPCSSEAKAVKKVTSGDDGPLDVVVKNVRNSVLQSVLGSEKVADISSFSLQSLLQCDEMKRCFDELLEEIARMQVQVASHSGEVVSKKKERVWFKEKEKEKALSVLAGLMEKLNRVKHLQKEAEQRELEVQSLTYDNGRLLEMVQELSQENVTLHENKVNAENQVTHLQKEAQQRQLEVDALMEENGRLRKMAQDNMTLGKVLKAEVARL